MNEGKMCGSVKLNDESSVAPDMCNDAEQLAAFVRIVTDITTLAEDNPRIRQKVHEMFVRLNKEYQNYYSVNSKLEVERKIKQYQKVSITLP